MSLKSKPGARSIFYSFIYNIYVGLTDTLTDLLKVEPTKKIEKPKIC